MMYWFLFLFVLSKIKFESYTGLDPNVWPLQKLKKAFPKVTFLLRIVVCKATLQYLILKKTSRLGCLAALTTAYAGSTFADTLHIFEYPLVGYRTLHHLLTCLISLASYKNEYSLFCFYIAGNPYPNPSTPLTNTSHNSKKFYNDVISCIPLNSAHSLSLSIHWLCRKYLCWACLRVSLSR